MKIDLKITPYPDTIFLRMVMTCGLKSATLDVQNDASKEGMIAARQWLFDRVKD